MRILVRYDGDITVPERQDTVFEEPSYPIFNIEAILTGLETGVDALAFVARELASRATVQNSVIHFSEPGIQYYFTARKDNVRGLHRSLQIRTEYRIKEHIGALATK